MKRAIIFRGPPAVGKSQVIDFLMSQVDQGKAARMNLDEGGGFGEARRLGKGTAASYADLRTPEELLFVELVWGEPGDGSFLGPTQNSKEWVKILRDDGRLVCSFLVWAAEKEWEQRLLAKNPNASVTENRVYYNRFKPGAEASNFPAVSGISEEQIDTTSLTLAQVKALFKTKLGI